ncbi:2-phospho-L-lactate guanylyltransferase [Halobacteriales archaeon QS_8_69_26]|nr:MAG: 2-phospho-L-lactate guanylyltransferase [Halobacteriales archaeon QS_8_69_26]
MRVVVPFDARRPKTRLAPVLDPDERTAFARAMLADVCTALVEAGADPEVLATAPVDPGRLGVDPASVTVTVDERPLTPAVNDVLAESLGRDPDAGSDDGADLGPAGTGASDSRAGGGDGDPDAETVAVVMADLALATPAAVERLLSAPGDVVLVPGRGGGTNAVLARHPGFRVDYHGVSYRDHRRIAAEAGAAVRTVDSYRLSTDVDERSDLPEVLLHGRPRSREWLRDRGFRVATDAEDRVTVARESVADGG